MTEINITLLPDFIEESREHLDEMESLLLQLSSDLENIDILNDIFRTMHNIKGTSQLTGLDKISRLSHRLEDLLDLLRQEKKQNTSDIVSVLITGRDRILKIVSELEEIQAETSSVDELIKTLNSLIDDDTEADNISVKDSYIQAPKNYESVNSEFYKEDNDEELFSIFHQHLKEHFSVLEQSVLINNSSIDENILLKWGDAVERIRSSANYMGYEELVDLLDGWTDDIEYAKKEICQGEVPEYEFMPQRLDLLVGLFPELDTLRNRETIIEKDVEKLRDSHVHEDSFLKQEKDSINTIEKLSNDITKDVIDVFSDQDVTENVLDVFAEEDKKIPEPDSHINLSLIDDFVDESREHLDDMESVLLRLKTGSDNLISLNDIFRFMHNIKGASQLTGLDKVSRLSHGLEDLLDVLRQQDMWLDQPDIQLLITGRDSILQLVNELEDSQSEISNVNGLIDTIKSRITELQTDRKRDSEQATNPPDTLVIPQIASGYYEEEYDQELYSIFITHLQQQLQIINEKRMSYDGNTNKQESLDICIEVVNRLRSSSNYMGYDELTEFYDHWLDSFSKVNYELTQGQDNGLLYVDSYLDELYRVFPDIKPDHETISDNSNQVENDQVISSSDNTVNINTSLDDALYSRLGTALDSSLLAVSNSEHEVLNEVFDELVSTKKYSSNESEGDNTGKQIKIREEKRKSNRRVSKGEDRRQSDIDRRKTEEGGEKKLRKSVRVDAEKIDALMNQVGELVVDRSYFFQLFNEMRELQQHLKDIAGIDQKDVKLIRAFTYRLSEAISALGRTSNELQEGVMKMRMLPVSHLFNRYPRLVHDLTSKSEKKVELVLRGEETELDKMIVEELSDPLIHIIRNAIDHGIESGKDRLNIGKSDAGKLVLEAYQESNHIVIEVTDDGRGMNPEKIKQKAISKKLYTHDEVERLTSREVLNLVLMPGFSTADKITGTSGRGVGMDVVKKNIEKLNGTLDIESVLGKGTQMRLKIPLTLAIIHALMVRVGKDMFTIPLANVDETVRISKNESSIVEGVEVIHLRGVALPIFRLSNLFKVSSDRNINKSFVVIVNSDGQRVGFVVDELLGQEEVVIKPLEDYVQDRSGFSGATIVGDGRISLILDVYELVKMTANRQIKRHKQQAEMLRITSSKANPGSLPASDQLH